MQKPTIEDDDDAELTEAELANMRPAREMLPASFFKAVERERELRDRIIDADQ
jgi:hypothetical protein